MSIAFTILGVSWTPLTGSLKAVLLMPGTGIWIVYASWREYFNTVLVAVALDYVRQFNDFRFIYFSHNFSFWIWEHCGSVQILESFSSINVSWYFDTNYISLVDCFWQDECFRNIKPCGVKHGASFQLFVFPFLYFSNVSQFQCSRLLAYVCSNVLCSSLDILFYSVWLWIGLSCRFLYTTIHCKCIEMQVVLKNAYYVFCTSTEH